MVLGLLYWLVIYVIDTIPIPDPPARIIKIALMVLMVLVIIVLLAQPARWRDQLEHAEDQRAVMGEVSSSRYIVQAGWDSVPHLDEKTKQELLDSTPEYLRDARSKGEPTMGSGVIYPIPISDIEVKPFAIPFGWKKGLCARRRLEPHGGAVGRAEPGRRHASTSTRSTTRASSCRSSTPPRSRPAASGSGARSIPRPSGSSQKDGKQLKDEYQSLGLILIDANNELEAGLIAVLAGAGAGAAEDFLHPADPSRPNTGSTSATSVAGSMDGQADHLMDCMRYLWRTWARSRAAAAEGQSGRIRHGKRGLEGRVLTWLT